MVGKLKGKKTLNLVDAYTELLALVFLKDCSIQVRVCSYLD